MESLHVFFDEDKDNVRVEMGLSIMCHCWYTISTIEEGKDSSYQLITIFSPW